MKKFILKTILLLCTLVGGTGTIWGENVTIISENFNNSSATGWTLTGKTSYQGSAGAKSLQLASSKGEGSAQTPSFSSLVGTTATLTFTIASSGSATNTLTITGNSCKVDGKSSTTALTSAGTVTIAITEASTSSSITFSAAKNGGCRIDDVNIYYTSGGGSSAVATTTTIDASGITNTNKFVSTEAGSLNASITYGTPAAVLEASVTWSGDDDDVATIDENTGAVTLVGAGTVTFTATYAGVTNTYQSSSDTYEMTVTDADPNAPGSENNPYTVAQALTAINALADNGTIDDKYVSGKISQIDSYSSGAITYWISDDGTTTSQLQVYKGQGLSGANFSAATDLEVGDLVVVFGQLKKYVKNDNTTPEFNSGSQLVSRTEKPASDLAKNSDIVLDYLNNNITADVTEYITSSSTGAYTFTIGDGTIIENADEIISALAVGTTTVTINQAATLSYKAGSVVINVTVQDTRTAASTIPAINISTLTEGAADGTIEVVNPVKADEGVTFSFASSDEDVLLIIGDAYTVGEVGTATVTVTATPNNTNLYKPVVANFNVTVQAAVMSENEITLAASSGSTVYGTPLNVNYTVADGYDGTMSYSIANSTIADVTIGASAITFTPKAVGSTTITISAPATGNFLAADDVEYTLTVTDPKVKETAFEAGTAVFDFTDNSEWEFPEGSSNKITTSTDYTADGKTITVGGGGSGNGYYYNTTSNYLLMGKTNATLTLPAFDKPVTQIDVVGRTGASSSVKQNIFVGSDTVSIETTGATGTNKYIIDSDYQAAGNIYTLKVTSNHNTQITSITVHFKGITADLNASGYATFCSEYPLDFSTAEDYSAWKLTEITNETDGDGKHLLTFEKITSAIKGGQGILLKGEANATVSLASANSSVVLNESKLVGVMVPTYVPADTYYGLKGSSFVKVNASTVPGGKALMSASDVNAILSSSPVKDFVFNFVDTETGITTTEEVSREQFEAIFDLTGRRLNKAQRGINIINGRKVIIK